ncbi:MAG: chromosomal replication initiator protein DnaA [Clostridia bacterium]|nr:chromosomal replication initiator protein DnaA [Clostridia bacterium]
MDSINEYQLSGIWQTVDEIMREAYTGTRQSYDLWFGRMKLTYLDADRAVLVCENKMKQSIVSGRYADLIAESLEKVIGYSPSIVIKIDPSLAPPISEQNDRESEYEPGEDEDFPEKNRHSASRPDIRKASEERRRQRDVYYDATDEDDDPIPDFAESSALFDAESDENESGEKRLTYNEDYTFENFIVGSSNRFAQAAALNVADNVGMKINPLFIWGPSGLGKTHLMYAIANRALSRDPKKKVIYVKGEEFMNQMIEAIRNGTNKEFRQKYRKADILLIDDIQFIAGKESTQTEFFHTFDALYEDKKQIIITSDRPPKELTALEDRIRSRFEAGLLVDIQPPDYELRVAILRNKINHNSLEVPQDVIDFLAQNLQENIRQLEGVVKKLAMKNLFSGDPINMEMVLRTVPEYIHNTEPVSDTVRRIIKITADRYGVKVEDVLGKERKKNIQTARNVSMFVVRSVTNASLPQIGAYFDRDHSTIHSNISKVESEMASDPIFEATVAEILKEVKRG